jgi:thioredoxin-like negative regulator of GroEL
MVEDVTRDSMARFLSQRPYAVIHIDAAWDETHRQVVSKEIESLPEETFQDVSFGYVDCDTEQEYARALGLRNVPAVAYYHSDRLVAVIGGADQDIAGNIRRLRRGDGMRVAR